MRTLLMQRATYLILKIDNIYRINSISFKPVVIIHNMVLNNNF